MEFISKMAAPSIGPVPALVKLLARDGTESPGKRERTRRQLLEAAVQVFSARGIASATLQEVAAVAGVANGTVYNHFPAKDDVVQAVALWIAQTLCRRISESYAHVRE